MLSRFALISALCFSTSAAAIAQTQDSDSQTLRKILAELRAIHQDMQVTETTQLLVAELQIQQGVVNRATEKADDSRARLNENHSAQVHLAADLERAQAQLDKSTSVDERNAITQEIERAKANSAELKSAERDQDAAIQDADQRLRDAKDKLETIEAELSAAVSHLSPIPKDAGAK